MLTSQSNFSLPVALGPPYQADFSSPLSSDHSRTRYASNIVHKLPTTLGHPLSLSAPRVSRSTVIRIVRDD